MFPGVDELTVLLLHCLDLLPTHVLSMTLRNLSVRMWIVEKSVYYSLVTKNLFDEIGFAKLLLPFMMFHKQWEWGMEQVATTVF